MDNFIFCILDYYYGSTSFYNFYIFEDPIIDSFSWYKKNLRDPITNQIVFLIKKLSPLFFSRNFSETNITSA